MIFRICILLIPIIGLVTPVTKATSQEKPTVSSLRLKVLTGIFSNNVETTKEAENRTWLRRPSVCMDRLFLVNHCKKTNYLFSVINIYERNVQTLKRQLLKPKCVIAAKIFFKEIRNSSFLKIVLRKRKERTDNRCLVSMWNCIKGMSCHRASIEDVNHILYNFLYFGVKNNRKCKCIIHKEFTHVPNIKLSIILKRILEYCKAESLEKQHVVKRVHRSVDSSLPIVRNKLKSDKMKQTGHLLSIISNNLVKGETVSNGNTSFNNDSSSVHNSNQGKSFKGMHASQNESTIPTNTITHVSSPSMKEVNVTSKTIIYKQKSIQNDLDAKWGILCISCILFILLCVIQYSQLWQQRPRNQVYVDYLEGTHYMQVKDLVARKSRYLPLFNMYSFQDLKQISENKKRVDGDSLDLIEEEGDDSDYSNDNL